MHLDLLRLARHFVASCAKIFEARDIQDLLRRVFYFGSFFRRTHAHETLKRTPGWKSKIHFSVHHFE